MSVMQEEIRLFALYRALGSWNSKVWIKAIQQARSLPSESLLHLAEIEAEHARLHRRSTRTLRCLSMLISYSCLLTGVAAFVQGAYLSCGGALLALTVWWNVESNIVHYLGSRARSALAIVASDLQDARLLPFALSMLWNENGCVNTAIWEIVRKFLPSLRAAEAAHWTEEHRRLLLRLLEHPFDRGGAPQIYDVTMSLHVLPALDLIGARAAEKRLEILLQMLCVLRRRLPVDSRGTVLARASIRLAQPVDVDVMCQRRERLVRQLLRQFRYPFDFR